MLRLILFLLLFISSTLAYSDKEPELIDYCSICSEINEVNYG